MIFSTYNLSTTVCLKCLVLGINRFNMVAPVGAHCYSLKLGGLWFGLHYSLTRQNRGCRYALVPSQNLLCQGNGPSSLNKTVTSSVWLRGRPFDSWGRLWFFCEKKIVQQIFENK